MNRFLLILTGTTVLAACDQAPSSGSSTQLANPAATYCAESGNRYEIRDGSDGQTGVCILSDGREVDAWEFFRENHTG